MLHDLMRKVFLRLCADFRSLGAQVLLVPRQWDVCVSAWTEPARVGGLRLLHKAGPTRSQTNSSACHGVHQISSRKRPRERPVSHADIQVQVVVSYAGPCVD